MSTIDSDGCRPPVLGNADHLFRRMASSFPFAPESVDAMLRNLEEQADSVGSGAG
jgi:hypothetical protein